MRTVPSLLLAAVVALGSACTTMGPGGLNATTSPATVDVTGSWAGTWAYENQSRGAGTLSGTLEQSGGKLSGNLTIIGPGGTDYRVVGFVSGNDITLSQPTPGNLTVDASGNQMTGIINGWDNAKITLHKQ